MNPARLWVTVQLDLDSTPVGSGLDLSCGDADFGT